jgi:branched-chain amino acid transport system substrate-binding protein
VRETRRRRHLITVVTAALMAVTGGTVVGVAPPAAAAEGTADRVGITRRTVTVAGIVGIDVASAGADVGAQARFARANRRGRTAGRTIEYLRTEPAPDSATADAAATKLGNEAFAVVPAVAPSVGASTLVSTGVPFFGVAGSESYSSRTGFGVTGVPVSERTRQASSPLGVQLRELYGGTEETVAVFHDADPTGTVRGEVARRSLRAAGFRAVSVIAVPAPPAAVTLAGLGVTTPPDGSVLLTAPARTTDLAAQIVAGNSAGTIVVGPEFYSPRAPQLANGLTVLVPIAPFEERTEANRRLATDVEAFAPGTELTPAIAAGYWSADLFLRALERVGSKNLTRATLLDALNGDHFTYDVEGTIGSSTWPEMHTQPVPCGSLVQSDGTQYLVAAGYRCAGRT